AVEGQDHPALWAEAVLRSGRGDEAVDDPLRVRPRFLRPEGKLEAARAGQRTGHAGEAGGDLSAPDGAEQFVAGVSRVLLPRMRHASRGRGADPLVPGHPRLRAGHRDILSGVAYP